MDGALLGALVVVLLVAVTLSSAYEHILPGQQGALLVGGEFRRLLPPGRHLVPPFVGTTYVIDEEPETLGLPTVRIDTPGGHVTVETRVTFRVTDAKAACASGRDYRRTVYETTLERRRDILDGTNPEQIQAELDVIADRIERAVRSEMRSRGIEIRSVGLSLTPPQDRENR